MTKRQNLYNGLTLGVSIELKIINYGTHAMDVKLPFI